MIVTTTSVIEGREVAEYLGIVSGRAIQSGLGESYDWRAAMKGGRRGDLEEVLAKADEGAIGEMTVQAKALGADAILGIRMDSDFSLPHDGLPRVYCLVSWLGTAVRLEKAAG